MEHLGLFWSYLSYSESESLTVFFLDSLFFRDYFVKILDFFLNLIDQMGTGTTSSSYKFA